MPQVFKTQIMTWPNRPFQSQERNDWKQLIAPQIESTHWKQPGQGILHFATMIPRNLGLDTGVTCHELSWKSMRSRCMGVLEFVWTTFLVFQVNIYMGLALLSMPYAMREAGWVGILALALSVGLLCLSAKLLTAGFSVIPFSEPHSYPNLGTFLSLQFWFWGCSPITFLFEKTRIASLRAKLCHLVLLL